MIVKQSIIVFIKQTELVAFVHSCSINIAFILDFVFSFLLLRFMDLFIDLLLLCSVGGIKVKKEQPKQRGRE